MYNAPPSVIAASKRNKIRNVLLELLVQEKKEEITIKCGLKILDQILSMSECTFDNRLQTYFVSIADCQIKIEKDFDLDPWHIIYNNEVLFSF